VDKRFLAILGAIVVIFIGIFAFSQHSNDKSSSGSGSKSQATSHVMGENQKNINFMEYGDYECPVCFSYYQPVKQAVAQYSKDIQFQFRNLPLVQIHKNAFAAARAAEAAGLQNKYWEMHDKLYETQDPTGASGWVASSNPLNFFTTMAQQIGLNIDQFKKDYSSSKVNNAINADLDAFKQTGQEMATPTFFLNGRHIPNSELSDSSGPSAAKISAVIKAEIDKQSH
jgi:protein-disulfide isomerase